MVKVKVTKDQIIIKGHANYGVSGQDIVCASVSSVALTTINAIVKIDKDALDCVEEDGYLKIDVLKHTDVIDSLIQNMIEALEDIEVNYKKYIKIDK